MGEFKCTEASDCLVVELCNLLSESSKVNINEKYNFLFAEGAKKHAEYLKETKLCQGAPIDFIDGARYEFCFCAHYSISGEINALARVAERWLEEHPEVIKNSKQYGFGIAIDKTIKNLFIVGRFA